MVVVQYTYEGEMGRRDLVAMGIVVRDDGLVIVPADFTPRSLPDEQIKDFKFILPGDDEQEIDAVLLGRDERYNLSFIAPKEKPKSPMTPIRFADTAVASATRCGRSVCCPRAPATARTSTPPTWPPCCAGRCRRCWWTAAA